MRIGTIAPALLARFESDAGYRNFSETIAAREQRFHFVSSNDELRPLGQLRLKLIVLSALITVKALRDLGVKTSIVSNADPRICEFPSSDVERWPVPRETAR